MVTKQNAWHQTIERMTGSNRPRVFRGCALGRGGVHQGLSKSILLVFSLHIICFLMLEKLTSRRNHSSPVASCMKGDAFGTRLAIQQKGPQMV